MEPTLSLKKLKLKAPSPRDGAPGGWKFILALIVTVLTLYGVTYSVFSMVPAPLPVDSPDGMFSEGRAMQTTIHLAKTIGHRQVSTSGEVQAANYLYAESGKIAEAAKFTRPDLLVTVEKERVSGALGRQKVFGLEIANAYNGLTNLILRIAPRNASSDVKSVLINAHYDSTLGSPGASDAASCVGVALEIARTIVYNSSIPLSTPLVFLFNGGEETLMQASHGFMKHSKYAKELGAFVNLESTGPWGPDVVFQHTGDWTLRAYSRVAPHPRGTTVGQDFFELGVIPADTDYRMFSYSQYGSLPGIDVAFLFDGAAYHTVRDEPDRIRPGTLQGMGENILATVVEYSRVLGTGDFRGEEAMVKSDVSLPPKGHVFFDVLSTFMIVYKHDTAVIVHQLPLILLLTISLVSAASSSSSSMSHRGGGISMVEDSSNDAFNGACPSDANNNNIKSNNNSLLGTIGISGVCVPAPGPLMRTTLIAMLSMLCSILVPAALGALKVLITKKPLSWYSNHSMAYVMYLPSAGAGLLIPYAGLVSPGALGASNSHHQTLGSALLFALMSTGLTFAGMHSGYLLFTWSACSILAVFAVQILSANNNNNGRTPTTWKFTWLNSTVICACLTTPILIVLPTAMSIAGHIMEKIGLAGSAAGVLGMAVPDAAIGALSGVGLMLTMGCTIPYIVNALGLRNTRIVIAALLTVSIASASVMPVIAFAKSVKHPYTYSFPKRIIIQHFHRHTNTTTSPTVYDSFFTFSSLDAIPIDVALPEQIRNMPMAPYNTEDWVGLYPVNYLVTGTARRSNQTQSMNTTFATSSSPALKLHTKTPTLRRITSNYYPSSSSFASQNASLSHSLLEVPSLVSGLLTSGMQLQKKVYDFFNRILHSSVIVITHDGDDQAPKNKKNDSTNTNMNIRNDRIVALELDTVRPGWAVLNITGHITSWSLGHEVASTAPRSTHKQLHKQPNNNKNVMAVPPESHMVRYASGAQSTKWRFWIEKQAANESVKIELFVKHLEPLTPATKDILDALPDWVSPAAVTTWHSVWEF